MKSRSPRPECRFKFLNIDRLENPTFAQSEHGAPKPGHLNVVALAEVSSRRMRCQKVKRGQTEAARPTRP
jgi:hypothetical protein